MGKPNITKTTRHQGGFTLVEVIAVLIILGVLSAVIISRMGFNSDVGIKESNQLRMSIRFAQARAMSDTVPWGLSLTSSSYTLQKNGATAGMPFPGKSSSTHTLPSGVTLTIGDVSSITFDFRGQPVESPGNSTPLTAQISIGITGAPNVTVEPYTGFVQ